MAEQKSYGFRPKLNGKIRGGKKNLTYRILSAVGILGTIALLSSLDSCNTQDLEYTFYSSNKRIEGTYLNENNASASENLVKYLD